MSELPPAPHSQGSLPPAPKPKSRRRRLIVIAAAVLVVAGVGFGSVASNVASSAAAQPYNGIDASEYATITCGEWLAASEAQQTGWAELDQDVSMDRAATDLAKENIKAWTVEQWAGVTKDACQERGPSSAAFVSPE